MLCGCGGGAKQTSKDKQGLGALCCAVRVLGLSQSKGLVLGLVLCAGAKQTKQGFGAWFLCGSIQAKIRWFGLVRC
jgi:hypothetical protein